MIIHDLLTLFAVLGSHPTGFMFRNMELEKSGFGWWYHTPCAKVALVKYSEGWARELETGVEVRNELPKGAGSHCSLCGRPCSMPGKYA